MSHWNFRVVLQGQCKLAHPGWITELELHQTCYAVSYVGFGTCCLFGHSILYCPPSLLPVLVDLNNSCSYIRAFWELWQVLLNRLRFPPQASLLLKELQTGSELGHLPAVCSTIHPRLPLNQNASLYPLVTSLWLLLPTHGGQDVEGTSKPSTPPSSTSVGAVSYPVCLFEHVQGPRLTPYKGANCFFGHLWPLVRSCVDWAGTWESLVLSGSSPSPSDELKTDMLMYLSLLVTILWPYCHLAISENKMLVVKDARHGLTHAGCVRTIPFLKWKLVLWAGTLTGASF